MGKNKKKPIAPMTINEALCLCRIAKGLGFKAQSIPSHSSATFVGVKVSGLQDPMNEKKFIISTFQNHYGGKRLEFTTETSSNGFVKEVFISVLS